MDKAVYSYYEEGIVPEVKMLDVIDSNVIGREPCYTGAGLLDNRYTTRVNIVNDNDYFGVVCNMIMNPQIYKVKEDMPLIGLYTYEGYGRDSSDLVDRNGLVPDIIESILVDYDDGEVSITEVLNQFSEYNVALYSTASDTDGTKFRLLIELEQGIHKNVYTFPENKKKLEEFFKGCDVSTFNWGRYFNVPALLETSVNYSHMVHMGGKRLSIEDLGLTENIKGYAYRRTPEEVQQEAKAYKYSMKAKSEGNATYLTAIKDGRQYLSDIASFLNDRGGTHQVHQGLLSAATTFSKAGINSTEAWRYLESEIAEYEYDAKVIMDIEKEFKDCFRGL